MTSKVFREALQREAQMAQSQGGGDGGSSNVAGDGGSNGVIDALSDPDGGNQV